MGFLLISAYRGYVAADCPLCGYVMIQALAMSLLGGGDEEAKGWEL
jgi:hypothetical protein